MDMNNQFPKKYNFYVQGMHCNACNLFIESELNNYPGVSHIKADFSTGLIEVVGKFGNKSEWEIADMLTTPIKDNGYSLSVERKILDKKWGEFKIAIPIAVGFLALFVFLQKIGLVNLINGQNITYTTSFMIGIVASISTCMAVVGGLLLSISATFAKDGGKFKSQLMFHAGRIISFFVFGGVIGIIGTIFTLNIFVNFVLSLAIGLLMLFLGINLLDVFHFSKKFQLRMPKFIAKHSREISQLNHSFAPFAAGIATFFLPCGFTQSMQFYTLSSGDFWSGAMTMFVFALGTLPVLALISFGSFKLKNSSVSGLFFKSAGLVVIVLALFNLANSLVAIGALEPFFDF